jgi:hypothetical protein
MLLVPVRGRGGACVGLLVCAKGVKSGDKSGAKESGVERSSSKRNGKSHGSNRSGSDSGRNYGNGNSNDSSDGDGRDGNEIESPYNHFSEEEVTAAEMCSNFAALALYWCQGLGRYVYACLCVCVILC